MKVILIENIKGVGRIGDMKNVTDGYSRNYLLPKNLAKLATPKAMKEVDFLIKKRQSVEKLAGLEAQKISEKLNNSSLEFTKKASETGTLFASVTKEEIAESLSKQTGFKIEPDSIKLGEHEGDHIKQLGEHFIKIELMPDIVAEIKVKVSQE